MMIWHGILALALCCALIGWVRGKGSPLACLIFVGALLAWVNIFPQIEPEARWMWGGAWWLAVACTTTIIHKSPNGSIVAFAVFLALKLPCYFLAEISGGPFGFGNVWLTVGDGFSILALVSAAGFEVWGLGRAAWALHRLRAGLASMAVGATKVGRP